jgi:hypothetical protein
MRNTLFFKARKFFIFFILLHAGFLQAQVQVEFGSLNEYIFSTKEALNLVLVNNNAKAFPVFIQGKITDAGGELVAEFKSAEVFLNVGANIITPMNTAMSDVNFHNSDIAEIEQRSGTYPSGNYQVCVWLTCVTDDCSGAGRNAVGMEQAKCMPVHIENPTPLILATPENDSEIEEKRPLFTWIPPSPVAGSSGLNYTMVLVEMMEGQNKADALSQNRPLIEAEGVGNPSLIFPSDLPELEPGKTYAWQVQAFVGKTPIAKSEQWKFKVKKDSIDRKKISRDMSYIEIQGQSGAAVFYGVGILKLRHVVRLESGSIKLKVTDAAGKVVRLNQEIFTINPGDNRLDLDLEGSMNFKDGKTYILTGHLLNGELFIIKFIYINPKTLINE